MNIVMKATEQHIIGNNQCSQEHNTIQAYGETSKQKQDKECCNHGINSEKFRVKFN